MKSNIISNILSLKERPYYSQFSLVFVDKSGESEVYIFFESTITQCVIETIGLVNFMLRVRGMKVVYIFPTNSTALWRNVYRRADGEDGHYKIVECHPDVQLDLFSAMQKWHEE